MTVDINTGTRPNLVFTSAGKHNNIQQWLGGVSFDVFVVYYADDEFLLSKDVRYVQFRKGGKFQNLHNVYLTDKAVLERYSSIMVMDDDIKISAVEIDRLFEFRKSLGADILQPAFDHRGKISHRITGVHPFTSYRITNFVEVTCPVFETRYLLDFLGVFDPRANGGGVDFWFCNYSKKSPRIVVLDEITCLNPLDEEKGGVREIDKFQSRQQRNQTWRLVKQENKLDFGDVAIVVIDYKFKLSLRQIGLYVKSQTARFASKILRSLKRLR